MDEVTEVTELRLKYDALVERRIRIQADIEDIRDRLEELGVAP